MARLAAVLIPWVEQRRHELFGMRRARFRYLAEGAAWIEGEIKKQRIMTTAELALARELGSKIISAASQLTELTGDDWNVEWSRGTLSYRNPNVRQAISVLVTRHSTLSLRQLQVATADMSNVTGCPPTPAGVAPWFWSLAPSS